MVDQSVKDKVLSTVDSMKDEIVRITVDTIKIPSVNPTYVGVDYDELVGGEKRVNEYTKPIMEKMGLQVDMWEETPGRANLVGVCKGSGGGKSLILNGHVDTVPPGPAEDWPDGDPFSGKIKDGLIYGRGAMDMKAGNACALKALDAVLKSGLQPKGDVIVEHVVGEEMMNTDEGTGATIKRGYKADGGICVEASAPPYPLAIQPASPGVFYLRVTVKGKITHACNRHELVRAGGGGEEVGVNSIDKIMVVYDALKKLEEEWGRTKKHPVYTKPGHFTLHAGAIKGGPLGAFIVSGESVIEYAVWHTPLDTEAQVKKEVEEQIKRYADADPWLRENPPKVEWLLWWPPYDVPLDAPITKTVDSAYTQVMGKKAEYYGLKFVDDATFLNQAGIPTVSIGPGDVRLAHSSCEFVPIDEMIDATKIYAMSILEWCGY